MQDTRLHQSYAKTNPDERNKHKTGPVYAVLSEELRYCDDRDLVVTTPSETIVILFLILRCRLCFFVIYRLIILDIQLMFKVNAFTCFVISLVYVFY